MLHHLLLLQLLLALRQQYHPLPAIKDKEHSELEEVLHLVLDLRVKVLELFQHQVLLLLQELVQLMLRQELVQLPPLQEAAQVIQRQELVLLSPLQEAVQLMLHRELAQLMLQAQLQHQVQELAQRKAPVQAGAEELEQDQQLARDQLQVPDKAQPSQDQVVLIDT